MMHMRTNRWPVAFALLVLLSACGGGTEQETLNVDEGQPNGVEQARLESTKKIFYSIPSPMETAALLKKAGATYNKNILNDVNNVDKYTSASKQALNLGVYGADLSYASVFNHTQESMFYTSCAKRLADRLGVSSAFNDSTLEAMEKSQNDRDALLDIISETYWEVDRYLKVNDRESTSALMIVGGWVEGLYIATQVAGAKSTPELRQRIAEQKISLGDLVSLLATYDDSDPALQSAREDLNSLQTLYADVKIGGGQPTSSTQADGIIVVGNDGETAVLTDAQLNAIRERVAAIRNSYIN